MKSAGRLQTSTQATGPQHRTAEIFIAFLRLGLTSFGGPIAHLGYFHAEFVERRRWLTDRAFADLAALAQFLPGPASSQTGVAIGLMRGGYLGGLAAWIGFTAPSAIVMVFCAYGAAGLSATMPGAALLHGLNLAAVAVVAQALLSMARSLCPDQPRATIAVAAAILVLALPGSFGQAGAILLGGLAGMVVCRGHADALADSATMPVSRRAGAVCLAAFLALLALSFIPGRHGAAALFGAFYRSGALVFGGGHVVLPLLHDAVVARRWLSDGLFLAGYGAAQALPGPVFTFAAYLGALASPVRGVAGAVIALLAIFLPGILVLMGVLPFWNRWRGHAGVQAVTRGINAAVVGILGAAFYSPVWTSAVHRPLDFAVALAGFGLLVIWRMPPLMMVLLAAAISTLLPAAT